jgi:hypothetical protein
MKTDPNIAEHVALAVDAKREFERASAFRRELASCLNRHSRENGSDTPDFILAEYLAGCLEAFDRAVARREEWYGRAKREADRVVTQETK